MRRACLVGALLPLQCGDAPAGRASPRASSGPIDGADVVDASPHEDPAPRGASPPRGRDVDASVGEPPSALLDRFPSLAFYPAVGAPLRTALQDGAPEATTLAALAETLAPYRWPSSEDWDRAGFIDLDAPVPGFITRIAGGSISQPTGRHDLGCAGGFLEGSRAVVSPRLGVAELERCTADTFAVEGAPQRCDLDHDFGVLALANIAVALPRERLPAGPTIQTWRPTPRTHATLARDGAVHLCTVSHASRARKGARFHHHMLIAIGDAEGLQVFDTTGLRGVAIQRMDARRFVRYVSSLLAVNREYQYDAESAELACLEVTPLSAAPRGSAG
jgi:hypothetical protein